MPFPLITPLRCRRLSPTYDARHFIISPQPLRSMPFFHFDTLIFAIEAFAISIDAITPIELIDRAIELAD
jgi:hypothetical protein